MKAWNSEQEECVGVDIYRHIPLWSLEFQIDFSRHFSFKFCTRSYFGFGYRGVFNKHGPINSFVKYAAWVNKWGSLRLEYCVYCSINETCILHTWHNSCVAVPSCSGNFTKKVENLWIFKFLLFIISSWRWTSTVNVRAQTETSCVSVRTIAWALLFCTSAAWRCCLSVGTGMNYISIHHEHRCFKAPSFLLPHAFHTISYLELMCIWEIQK